MFLILAIHNSLTTNAAIFLSVSRPNIIYLLAKFAFKARSYELFVHLPISAFHYKILEL